MKRTLCLIILAMAATMAPAMADTWTFSFNGQTIHATGWLEITSLVATGGEATFTYNGGPSVTVDLLAGCAADINGHCTSPSGLFWYNDQMSPGTTPQIPPYPNNPGIAFVSADHSQELNLWYQTDISSYVASGEQNGTYYPRSDGWGEPGTFSLTAVPEPGAIFLLLTMLAGVAGVAGAKKKAA